MAIRSVDLTENLDHFIEAGVASGRFSNASEVVREGLELLRDREQERSAKLDWLRAAAKEGFDEVERGSFVELRSDVEIDSFVEQLRRDVTERLAAQADRG